MIRGRVGGRIGNRDASQPSTSVANGTWTLQEAYDALRRGSWPISRDGGFSVAKPRSINASCPLAANFSAPVPFSGDLGSGRSSGWADPMKFVWEKSLSNSNFPSTGNPWLSENFEANNLCYYYNSGYYCNPLNPSAIYATGISPSPFVKVEYDYTASSDPLFSQVTLFSNFNNGCFDRSNSKRTAYIRRGGSLTTARYRNGTRSFTNGTVSWYGGLAISGNFCIEGWFWFNDSTDKRPLFSLGTVSPIGKYFQLSLNANRIEIERFGQQPIVLMSNVVDVQSWTHIALCRSGSTVRLYVDGIESGSTTDSDIFGDSLLAGNVQVYAKSEDFVDEFRITIASRYSGNFTPSSGSLEPAACNRPKVVVSGAGTPIANDTFHPRATGDAGWDEKQFFSNDKNDCCVFWDSTRGVWVISYGSSSGPAGDRNFAYTGSSIYQDIFINSGTWLYASDGSCWAPVTESEKFYNIPSQSLSLTSLGFSDNETFYRLRGVSGFLDAASSPATLTVEPIAVAFTQEPTDQFAASGSATFTATVKATGQFSGSEYTGFLYQWQKRPPGSTGAWENIDGATNASALISGVSPLADNGAQFRLRAAPNCEQSTTVFSRTAILYVGAPTAPQNLVGIPGDSQVGLSWSAPSSSGNTAVFDYVVQYSSNGGATWTTFSDGTGTTTSATVTGLTNGTGYIFRVAAVNSIGSGPFCTPTPRLVPAAAGTDPYFSYVSFVSNFEGENNSTVFEDQSLAARTVTRFGDAKISTVESKWGSAAYFDGTGDYLSVSDPLAFRIGNQDFTVEAWVYPTTTSGGEKPVVTTADPADYSGFFVGISPSEWSWKLGATSWSASGTPINVAGDGWYHIALSRSGGNVRFYVNGTVRQTSANSTNVANSNELLRIGGRTVGSQYFQGYIGGLRVTKGVDRYPLGTTFTVPSAPFPVSVVGATPPDAPTLVTATAGTRQAVVSWTAPNNNGSGIKDYLIQYSSNGGTTWTNLTDSVSKSTTATVTGLADDTGYVFRVAAVNYIGTGPYSTASSPASTNALPGAPTGVSGTPGNGEVALSWAAPASNGGASITDYVVQYSSNSGSTWTTFSDGTSATLSTTVSGLSNGTGYLFRVAAVTSVGTGSYSTASSSISPTGTVPNAPTTLNGTPGDTQVSLTWAAPANNGGSSISDYVVQYSSNSGSTWTTFSDGTSSVTAATVTGLTNGTAYIFRVAATNSQGAGAYSTASSSITPNLFTPMAILLTSGTSYTIPAGATSMKAWAVSGATPYRAGGVSYKTWSASGGTTVSYSLGAYSPEFAENTPCEITYDGYTISADSESPYFTGGDGGAEGGETIFVSAGAQVHGGAIGGNSASLASCGRRPATDVSGLLAAVALAGEKTTEDCAASAAFGSGCFEDYYDPTLSKDSGIGGANYRGSGFFDLGGPVGGPAVVLYFT